MNNRRMKQQPHFVGIILLLFVIAILGLGCYSAVMSFLNGGRSRNLRQPQDGVLEILSQAPCIAGVCPGVVGRASISEVLSRNGTIEKVIDNGGSAMHYTAKDDAGGAIVFELDAQGKYNVVQYITFWWDSSDITLDRILDILGEPDALFLMFGCGHGEHIYAKLFYRETGIEVTIQYPANSQKIRSQALLISLVQDTLVSDVTYFNSGQYDEWLLEILDRVRFSGYFDISASVTANSIVSAVQAWPGFNRPIKVLDTCPR